MRKSRLLAIMSALAVLVAMVLVVGCGSSDDDSSSSSSSSDSVSSELITEGTLTVGTDTPYPPFEFGKAPDYDGFDIDMTNAIADATKSGRKAVLVQLSRDDSSRFVALPVAQG